LLSAPCRKDSVALAMLVPEEEQDRRAQANDPLLHHASRSHGDLVAASRDER
jgi:hypothetical protein